MHVLKKRGEIIQWAGTLRAYPVLRGSRPELARPGDDETGASRVGWEEFFRAFDHHGLVLVVESPDNFEHRFLAKRKAQAELPATAFGPPFLARLWHEVNLRKPPPAV
jgi:hypothetical protein